MKTTFLTIILCAASVLAATAKKTTAPAQYVPAPYTWTTQSTNSSESMPCGGHDIGMNVWVENDDVLIYLSRSGFFDENNTLLKAGRLRIKGLGKGNFSQTLTLDDGSMTIRGGNVAMRLWADVEEPVVFCDITCAKGADITVSYESWRHHDRVVPKEANQQFSWKWLNKGDRTTYADSIRPAKSMLTFEHHNRRETVYDYTVSYEHLDAVKASIPDPIGDLSFGGRLSVPGLTYTGCSDGQYASTDFRAWNYSGRGIRHTTISVELLSQKGGIAFPQKTVDARVSARRSAEWWHQYWQRSYIRSSNAEAVHILRNYELFRYMLGCNAYGAWPTKFNGGLFCFDPEYVDSVRRFTPDYRCWGGGTMTAQNQRLVYWPMLKSGDVDMMAAQFDTYLRMLPAAMARTKHYWGHGGACFEEQIENFGLPNPAEYGKHKGGADYGNMDNKWLEHLWDTSLEFCQMILDANEYYGLDITKYRPLIRECLVFFDEHYQMEARRRGACALSQADCAATDSVYPKGSEKLVIYPGSGAETYKMAYNPSSTVAALHYVLESIDRKHGGLAAWGLDTTYIQRLPDIPLHTIQGRTCISPAVVWERIQNVESPQMYPVFPWRIYGLGRPDLEVALNTYHLDPWVQKMRSSRGWKQDNIWAPLLGEVDDARRLCQEKFADGPYRFPAFWEMGFDWAPDHNRGGSAMIGLQEMLLQEAADGELLLFPCWPREWDANFRLHASKGRTVNAAMVDGKVVVE